MKISYRMLRTYFYNAEPPKRQRSSERDKQGKEETPESKKSKLPRRSLSVNTHPSPVHRSRFIRQYIIRKRIARGAYGEVFLAIDRRNQIRTAMKRIELNSPSDRKGFQNEVFALKSLMNCDYVARFSRAFNHMNYGFICTEYLTGDELYTIVEEHKLPELIIKQIMFEVLSAVRYAHDRKIAHLDIKPSNIVLSRPWFKQEGDFPPVKLIDWGLSKRFIDFEDKEATLSGTYYYMAPEILGRRYNHKVDIWAAGVVMYLLISGELPFFGQTPIETLNLIHDTLPSYENVNFTKIDTRLKVLLQTMLTKDISWRPEAHQILDMAYFTDGSVDRTPLDTVTLRMNKNIHYGRFRRFILKKIIPDVSTADRRKLAFMFDLLGSRKDKVLPSEARATLLRFFQGNRRISELLHQSFNVFTGEHALDVNEFIFAMLAPLYNTRAKLEYFYNHKSKSFKITPQMLMIFFMNNKKGQQVFREIDTDGNGEVDVEEFIQWMLKER